MTCLALLKSLRDSQEEAERRAAVAKKSKEDEIAKKFAEEMGMGDVGKKTGMAGAVGRIRRRLGGGDVSFFNHRSSPVGIPPKLRAQILLPATHALTACLDT